MTDTWPPGRLSYAVPGLETKEGDTLVEDPAFNLEDEVAFASDDESLAGIADSLTDDDPDPTPNELKYDVSPVGTPGGKQNWVDKVGGLPAFIRAIAHALIRNGHSESQAIQIAVGTVQNWASGRGKVNAKTKAKAIKTLAEWEAKKTASRGRRAVSTAVQAATSSKSWKDAVDAVLDTSTFDGGMFSVKALDPLDDSLEELRAAVCDAVKGITGDDYAVLGTWPDRMALLNTEGKVFTVGIGWNEEASMLAIGNLTACEEKALTDFAADVIEAAATDTPDDDTAADPSIEHNPIQVKLYGGDLAGSYEALRSQLQSALRSMLNPDMGDGTPGQPAAPRCYGYVCATFPDYFLAEVENYASGDSSLGNRMLKVGYTYNEDDDSVSLGEVVIVQVKPNITEIQDLGKAGEVDADDVTGTGSEGTTPAGNAPAGVSTKTAEEDTTDTDDPEDDGWGMTEHKDLSEDLDGYDANLETDLKGLDLNAKARMAAAQKGEALPDGSYPIRNKGELHRAMKSAGRAKNKSKVKAHIRKRAQAMKLDNMLTPAFASEGKSFADAVPDRDTRMFLLEKALSRVPETTS